MNNRTLYQIDNEYQYLLNETYDPETGEIIEPSETELNNLKQASNQKCINVAKVIKDLEKNRLAISEEKKNMQARETALKNRVEWLKNYLINSMRINDRDKITCTEFIIALQKNPVSLDITDDKLIPSDYRKVIIQNDDAKIKADLKKGIEVPGARLIQKTSVRFK